MSVNRFGGLDKIWIWRDFYLERMILNFLPVGLATQVERTRKKKKKTDVGEYNTSITFFFFFFKYLASFFLENFIFYFDKLSNHVRFFLLLRHVIFFFLLKDTHAAQRCTSSSSPSLIVRTDTHTGEREFRLELFFVRLRIERTKKNGRIVYSLTQPTTQPPTTATFFFRLVVKM